MIIFVFRLKKKHCLSLVAQVTLTFPHTPAGGDMHAVTGGEKRSCVLYGKTDPSNTSRLRQTKNEMLLEIYCMCKHVRRLAQ